MKTVRDIPVDRNIACKRDVYSIKVYYMRSTREETTDIRLHTVREVMT